MDVAHFLSLQFGGKVQTGSPLITDAGKETAVAADYPLMPPGRSGVPKNEKYMYQNFGKICS